MILRIECPKCEQSFEVSEELKGRTVECGSCEHRFQVSDEVMATSRDRVYPDEIRKDTDLSRFGRAPSAASKAPVEFRTMEYNPKAKPAFVGPLPPVRNFATVVGLLILVICALAFYFGTRSGGSFLQDVELAQRYVVAGFFGVVALGLLSWGMMRNRVIGILIGLLGVGGLMSMAHFLPVLRSPRDVGGITTTNPDPRDEKEESSSRGGAGITEQVLTAREVMKMTRWESTVLPLTTDGDDSYVAAIWVRQMEEFHNLQIKEYLKQELELLEQPYFRTLTAKGRDGGIFVMSGQLLDLDRVEAAAERLGTVEQAIPELRVVQIALNPLVLGGDVNSELNAKLINPEGEAFYKLNYDQLISLDKNRVKDAIKRLSKAEPLRFRKDITVRLIGILGQENDAETAGLIADTLAVWSVEGDGADVVLVDLIVKMRSSGKSIPDAMLHFLAARKTPSAANLLVDLWAEDPSGRQRFLEAYGTQISPLMEPHLLSPTPALARSAARILGQVGAKSQLPSMREALQKSKDEALKVSLQQAIQQVERRG